MNSEKDSRGSIDNCDAAVVGGGLFGATIARALCAEGWQVALFDDRRPLSGSRPSGSLMKPGWFAGLGKDVYEPSLALLDRLYGVRDLEFRIRPSGLRQKVHWVPTSLILDHESAPYMLVEETVTSVGEGFVEFGLPPTYMAFPLVVVAAGAWCNQLLQVQVEGKQGVSFRWPGRVEENTIQGWAPYKQAVWFQESEGSCWAGDGSAILPANWTTGRMEDSRKRMARLTTMRCEEAVEGIRPYVKGHKPCLLQQRAPCLWLATGGAKNGLVAAGWAASEIVRQSS